MRAREWVNNNSTLITTIAVLLLALSLGVIYFQSRGAAGDGPRTAYFLDLETEELFQKRTDTVPPVTAPSGGRGVWANLYTCGECTPDEWFGYLETFSEHAKQVYEEQGYLLHEEEDHLVRDPHEDDWVWYYSDRGERLRERVGRPCPDDPESSPTRCQP